MASIKLYHKTGDEKAVKIQEMIEKKFGFIPEVFQAMGRSGDFLEAMMTLSEKCGKGLDKKTKELIALAVTATNGCGYCFDAHRAIALKEGISEEEITAAVEVAAMMSAFNKFNDAIGLNHDIKA